MGGGRRSERGYLYLYSLQFFASQKNSPENKLKNVKKCIIIRKENYLHFPTCVQCRSRELKCSENLLIVPFALFSEYSGILMGDKHPIDELMRYPQSSPACGYVTPRTELSLQSYMLRVPSHSPKNHFSFYLFYDCHEPPRVFPFSPHFHSTPS